MAEEAVVTSGTVRQDATPQPTRRAFLTRTGQTGLALLLAGLPLDAMEEREGLMAQTRTIRSGNHNGTIEFGGLQRTYLLHVPPSYTGQNATPLVFVFHGGEGTGEHIADVTQFSQCSDQNGFLVVYPDGVDQSWNDGRGTTPAEEQGVDDVGFVTALLGQLAQTLYIAPQLVYATGLSNGARFTHRLGCEISEKIAAIGPVAGTMAENIAQQCAPQQPVSVVEFHGTEDPINHWDGGEVQGEFGGMTLSVPKTVLLWVNFNGCPPSPQKSMLPDTDPNDGTRVWRKAYSPGESGCEVVLYGVEGGGHTWPGTDLLPTLQSGTVTHDINATQVIWDFFADHPKSFAGDPKERAFIDRIAMRRYFMRRYFMWLRWRAYATWRAKRSTFFEW
jgi:polyhydroxybutyrate depolymerase